MLTRHSKRKLIMGMAPRHVDLKTQPLDAGERSLVKLARQLSTSLYTVNNSIKIFTVGADKFKALKEDLANATGSIYLQYYIFNDDHIGHEIAEILKRKARLGLDVKVIYDHIGSFSAKNSFWRDMQEAGVDTHPFFRVNFPHFANRVNWRNHRKLVIIDNSIGYIGGMNIADRYDSGPEEGAPWRDTHFRLEGDIVESLLFSFIVDWNFLKQPHPIDGIPRLTPTKLRNSTGMQLVTSGPLSLIHI